MNGAELKNYHKPLEGSEPVLPPNTLPPNTATAMLRADETGKAASASELPWQPSCHLRWLDGTLQQEWWRFGLNSTGLAIGAPEYEWRDVESILTEGNRR
jgi:hypothetical protein